MKPVNKQIGWSQEASLLQAISNQLSRLATLISASGGDVSADIADLYFQINGLTSYVLTPQITISTSVSIDTVTTGDGYGQKGKTVVISNGANAINYTCNGTNGFNAVFFKNGTGAITFVAGSGRSLVTMDGTAVLNGIVGSRATLISVGTIDYLYIVNY